MISSGDSEKSWPIYLFSALVCGERMQRLVPGEQKKVHHETGRRTQRILWESQAPRLGESILRRPPCQIFSHLILVETSFWRLHIRAMLTGKLDFLYTANVQ